MEGHARLETGSSPAVESADARMGAGIAPPHRPPLAGASGRERHLAAAGIRPAMLSLSGQCSREWRAESGVHLDVRVRLGNVFCAGRTKYATVFMKRCTTLRHAPPMSYT